MHATNPAVLTQPDARGATFVTLNRPERRNALGGEMLEALAAALDALRDDPSVRCVVLRSAGKHFCAGGEVDPAVRADARFGGRHRRTSCIPREAKTSVVR